MQDTGLTGDPSAVADALARRVSAGGVATLEGWLWVAVLASLALDVYTTYLGLSAGLAEGNPAMRWAMESYGFGALVAAKLLAVAVALAAREARPRYGWAVALGLALPWTLTVLVNGVTLATV